MDELTIPGNGSTAEPPTEPPAKLNANDAMLKLAADAKARTADHEKAIAKKHQEIEAQLSMQAEAIGALAEQLNSQQKTIEAQTDQIAALATMRS